LGGSISEEELLLVVVGVAAEQEMCLKMVDFLHDEWAAVP
jgi:hypothetical protein